MKTPTPTAQNTAPDMVRAALEMILAKVELRKSLKAQGRPYGHVTQGIRRMEQHLINLGVSPLAVQDSAAKGWED